MDINNNQQINTFVKGMNTDTSDALLGSDQYRYAENLRLVTNTEENTGELRLIEGDKFLCQFDGEILYLTSIREYIIVILRENDEWCVKVTTHDNYDDWETIFGPCSDPIWTETVALCGVTRWESERNVKLYLTDNTGLHNIMIFNVDEYHWPRNVVERDDTYTTPTDILIVAGFVQGALPSPEVVVSDKYGNLKPARVLYAYRFYRYGGASTLLSALSNILSLYKTNTQGYKYGEVTSSAVDITIPVPQDKTLNRVQIYRITYEQLGQVPSCALVYDGDAVTSYTDTGIDISTLAFDELQGLDTLSIKPKIIESKENYLFAADVQYETDNVDKLFEDIDMTSISTGNRENKYNHSLFENEDSSYNSEWWWKPGTTTPGGVGEHVDWEYAWDDVPIGLSDELDKKDQARYLKHDETYRFGAILYDNKGRKSSVKWIADIRIPNLKPEDITINISGTNTPTGVEYIMRQCYIKFTIHGDLHDVDAIQIVRCNREINDTRVISQGIVGRPLKAYAFDTDAIYGNEHITSEDISYVNYIINGGMETLPAGFDQDRLEQVENILSSMKLAPSGYMTMLHILIDNFDYNPMGTAGYMFGFGSDDMRYSKFAVPVEDVLLFASPEYSYAQDSIKDIISSYKDKLKLEHVLQYDTFNKKISENDWGLFIRPWSWLYDLGYSIRPATRNNSLVTNISGNTISFDNIQLNGDLQMITMHDTNDYHLIDSPSNPDLNNFKTLSVYVDSEEEPVIGHVSFNHILPAHVKAGENISYGNIERAAYPDVPDWNAFSKNTNFRYLDDVTTIGTYSFVNWTFALGLELIPGEETNLKNWMRGSTGGEYERDTYYKPIGTGGKCILFKTNNKINTYLYTPYAPSSSEDPCWDVRDYVGAALPINVVNLVKPVRPYGGLNERSVLNSTYYQYGAYWKVGDNPIIDFKYGDCSATLFTYNCAHNWYDIYYPRATKMGTVYMVPLESDIDIRGTYGDTLRDITKRGWYVQDKASVFEDYSQQYDAYLYNPAYGLDSTTLPLSTAIYTDISSGDFDTRVHFSDPKTNGEWIDNWTKFKAANFTDVDTRYGSITDMRLFKDRLVFWLNNATGILRVNQRSVIQDENNVNLVLGNGGVLDGYDYISTVYGMKKGQFADAQSNTGLYWWDGNAKAILQLGEQVVPLSTLKNITNYINSNEETAKPNLVYDNKYKELICNVVGDGSVAYSEVVGAFISVYKMKPLFDTKVFEDTIITNNNSLYKINESGEASTLLGDTEIYPKLKYVVNKDSQYNKVFDITTFGGRFYGGDDLSALKFKFNTPLKQESNGKGNDLITNREYDFRLTIPRNNNDFYGGRMRGKTMQCELSSSSNSTDFSIQYTITKYRMSWG